MSQLPLIFRPLPEALSAKKILAFHKDAGWTGKIAPPAAPDPRGIVQWVAVELGQRQIAVVRLELAPPEFCIVGDLIIKKDYRGQGIGQWFIRAIEQYCASRGIRRLLLQPASGSEGFYASLGFHADPMLPAMLKKDISLFRPKMVLPQSR
jgi:GNAT superfamily N-acetyltransferase